MDLQLSGRKAMVTGGSRGIGRCIVELLAREGASVATCSRSGDQLAQTLQEFNNNGLAVVGRRADVGSGKSYRDWLQWSLEQLNGVDIFVHNATSGEETGALSDWEAAFRVDLMGAVIGCDVLKPHLDEYGNSAVIFISSLLALKKSGDSSNFAYGAMKAALTHYASQLSLTAGPRIRVNVVCPGPIEFAGGFWDGVRKDDPNLYKDVVRNVPAGRLGSPEEVAYAVAVLASPRAAFITGANLLVDGGRAPHVDF